MWTRAIVMGTQTPSSPCPSRLQHREDTSRGIWKSVHPRWRPHILVELQRLTRALRLLIWMPEYEQIIFAL